MDWLSVARSVMQNRQAEEVDGVLLDMATAGLLVGIHDNLNPENQAKFAELPLGAAVDTAWKLVNRGAVEVGFASKDARRMVTDAIQKEHVAAKEYATGYKQGFTDGLREAVVVIDDDHEDGLVPWGEDCEKCGNTGVIGSTGSGFGSTDFCDACEYGADLAGQEARARDHQREIDRDMGYF